MIPWLRTIRSLCLLIAIGGSTFHPLSSIAATFLVINVNDTGEGSLREAIAAANSTSNQGGLPDRIEFSIAGDEVHTISPLSSLPTITDPVILDGYTQPGAARNTNATGAIVAAIKIELDGTNAGPANGLTVTAGNTVIQGLAINRFTEQGIYLQGAGGNAVEGNFIGTNVAGTEILQNGFSGIFMDSPNNTIGGTAPGARNLSSGNFFHGVEISGEAATGNVVQGNLIGTNAAGNAALTGTDSFGVILDGAGDNLIGGTLPGAGNTISGNRSHGIEVRSSSGNRIEGNFIGTDALGTAVLSNGGRGVQLNETTDSVIGGTTPGARNVISGNANSGVRILNPGSTGNLVQGNYIGTDVHGAVDLGNGTDGVVVNSGPDNMIGGTVEGADNLIAFNSARGVSLLNGVGASILGNSMFSNDLIGIDLGNDGVTANDPGDGDTGANNLQNFPVLDSVSAKGSQVTILGSLSTVPNTEFHIEVFANSECDPTNHGEGSRFLGSFPVMTDSTGNASINSFLNSAVFAGEFVTATATVIQGPADFGDTSEFSECVSVIGGTGPTCADFDFDASQFIDAVDLLDLYSGYQTNDLAFDISGNGVVDEEDLLLFSACWRMAIDN